MARWEQLWLCMLLAHSRACPGPPRKGTTGGSTLCFPTHILWQPFPTKISCYYCKLVPFYNSVEEYEEMEAKRKENGDEDAHRVILPETAPGPPRFLWDAVGTIAPSHDFLIFPCIHIPHPRNSRCVNCKVKAVSYVASGTWYNANRFPYVVPSRSPRPQAPTPRENAASLEMPTF